MKKPLLFLLSSLLSLFSLLGAEEKGTLSGYMISDYYAVFQNHDAKADKQHGFWFRRIYLSYDRKLDEKFAVRLRFEMNSPGDFTTNTTLNPFVKDAYLEWKASSQHRLLVGILSTPTFENIENFWGYRSLEKTPLDLQKYASSRDFGLSLKGSLDKGKKVTYALMFGNSSGDKAEVNKNKKGYALIGYEPVKGLYFELYGDYEDAGNQTKNSLLQGFVGYKAERGRGGILLARKHQEQGSTEKSWDVLSLFSVISLNEKIDAVLRFDRNFDANPQGAKIAYTPFATNASSSLLMGALSYKVNKNLQIIPNLKAVFYGDPDTGSKPENDLYGAMTIYVKF